MIVALHHRDSGSGMPLVLLHAFPLSSAMWLAQRESLGDKYRVITPDQRGFGGSPLGDDPPSLDLAADDVAALLDEKGLSEVVLGGLSMGGYVAMAFLRRYPDRVRAVILADTRALPDPPPVKENRERIARVCLETSSSAILLEEVLPMLVGPTTVAHRPLVIGRIKGLVQAAPPAAVAWAERAMAARPDSTAVLESVRVPLLTIAGEEDGFSPPEEAEAMAGLAPQGRCVRIPEAGHLSAVERPELFNAAVTELMQQL
jgi:pimeloyl-ACP methyl ester carboxylesterase